MAAPAPRCVCVTAINLSSTAPRSSGERSNAACPHQAARVPGLTTFNAADRKGDAIDGDGRLRRRLVRAVGRCGSRQLIDTVKAHCERLRRHFRREVKGHEDSIFVMIVFVPRRLVPVGPKPFAYCGHRSRKLSGAYPDRRYASYLASFRAPLYLVRCRG
jgi:hypothetical protein